MIKCNKCNQVKPAEEFHQSRIYKDGQHGYCKSCAKEYQARYRVGNKTVAPLKTKGERQEEIKNKNVTRRATIQYMKRYNIKAQNCQMCGNEKAECHHPDYSDPYTINFLCGFCHRKVTRYGVIAPPPISIKVPLKISLQRKCMDIYGKIKRVKVKVKW